jgi:putative transposase
MVAEQALDIQALKAITATNWYGPRRRGRWHRGSSHALGAASGGCAGVLALDRNTLRYRSRRRDDGGLRTRIREIAERKRREGWRMNHQTVERLYREDGLSLRRRARRKATVVPRVALPVPSQPGRCYAMDCVHDRLATGRRFMCVTMTDLCSKEEPVIEVDASIGGERVCRILDRLFAERSPPEVLILDNGPEFARTALDAWAGQHGVSLHFIQPGKPVLNACIESFNGTFRDECVNEHWFLTLQEAQVVIEAWRQEYNEERTHSTIEDVTPMEFIQHHQTRTLAAQESMSLALV